MLENFLYICTYTIVAIYLYIKDPALFGSYSILIPASLASCLGCLCITIEETPCNATIVLLHKVITVLRFLIALCVLLKIDNYAHWDWSTAFWPYWCSFAIQVIMGVASLIIFVNTIFNYFKDEAIIEDSKYLHCVE